jgi:cytidylate kinase
MIISLGGKPGAGKSVVARLLAQKLKFKHYSSGDFTREIAKQKGITVLELAKLEELDKSIDEQVDKQQAELGKKEDNFVIDSRLGFHFIPRARKIFLDADIKIRAKRILEAKRTSENNSDLNKAIENIKEREKSEEKRYMNYYNINLYKPSNYDLVIDTSNLNVKETVNQILEFLGKR